MKTAVIYARYSSDRQTEQSIEGQVRVCNDYAERNDILIVNQYVDRATTGTNDNRDAFQQMMKDSDKKAWDYVLVYRQRDKNLVRYGEYPGQSRRHSLGELAGRV